MKNRINSEGLCCDEYESNETYSEVHYKRAIGELPEMECSKAIASLLAPIVLEDECILDVGCGGGHYLRSFKNKINVPFRYEGIDPYPIFLNKAIKAWKNDASASFQLGWVHELPQNDKSVDYTICCNVLTHLPKLLKPITELIRVTRKRVIIRHPISDKSYRIQLVYNNEWWPYTDVEAHNEFDELGQPRAFSYFDIHSKSYFTSLIQKVAPHAKISYIEDNMFDSAAINRSNQTEKSINATQVINGMQVTGCILLPHYFVCIDLNS